jgi:hypothetical protein
MKPIFNFTFLISLFLLFLFFQTSAQKRSLVNKMWQTNYDTPVDSVPWGSSADVDAAGDIIVTGSNDSGGHSWISTRMIAPTGTYSAWHAVYNYSNGAANDFAARVMVKGSYVYVLGASYSSTYDIVLIQYDLSGAQQWVSRYDGGGADFPVAMTIDDNGNAFVVGTSTDGGAGKDMITLEVDINGNQTFLGLFDYNNMDDIATGITLSPDQS